ncbi:MAG: MrpF/PhaF family protein [Salinibacterium sp.]|nr:MrpF/PhaF family protein [Salinibacterium sp.]
MIASDVLLTTLMLVVGADMVIKGHTRSIPIMLVLSAIAIFATVAVARYVTKQDRAITGVEAAVPEAAVPEAAVPEAAVPEAAVPEAAVPEAALTSDEPEGSTP